MDRDDQLADEMGADGSATKFSRRSGVDLDVVYCLGNEAMPGWFKIGFTTRTSAARARDLYAGYGDEYTTGVPVPFEVVREWELPRGRGEEVERAIHRALKAHRPNPSREFFRFDGPEQVVAAIDEALRALDWYATAVADAIQKRLEAEQRAARIKAAADAQRREQLLAAEISNGVERKMRAAAEDAMRNTCQTHGLKWAAIVGTVTFAIGAGVDARDSYMVVVIAFSIGAYYWNRSTPLDDHIASEAYRSRAADVKERALALLKVERPAQAVPQAGRDPADTSASERSVSEDARNLGCATATSPRSTSPSAISSSLQPMKSLTQPISPERKEALLKLARMDPKQRTRLLELEALRRGIKPTNPLDLDEKKRLAVALARMEPEQRARLLELEALRRGINPKTGTSEMLTPSEVERLRQSALDLNAYGRKAFPPKNWATPTPKED